MSEVHLAVSYLTDVLTGRRFNAFKLIQLFVDTLLEFTFDILEALTDLVHIHVATLVPGKPAYLFIVIPSLLLNL